MTQASETGRIAVELSFFCLCIFILIITFVSGYVSGYDDGLWDGQSKDDPQTIEHIPLGPQSNMQIPPVPKVYNDTSVAPESCCTSTLSES